LLNLKKILKRITLRQFTHLIEKLSHPKNETWTIDQLNKFFGKNISDKEKTKTLKLLLNVSPKRIIGIKKLKSLSAELTGFPTWIIERSEAETGSFIRALALLLHNKSGHFELSISDWMADLSTTSPDNKDQLQALIQKISTCPLEEKTILLKLLTGTLKSPVSKLMIVKSIALHEQIPLEIAALRLYEMESGTQIDYAKLKNTVPKEIKKIPNSFPEIKSYEANLTDKPLDPETVSVYGKKEGIIAQLVKYDGNVYLWSADGLLLNDTFPEVIQYANSYFYDFKVMGQIIPNDHEISIEALIARMSKKNISKKDLEASPAHFEIWQYYGHNLNPQEFSKLTGFQSIEKINCETWDEFYFIHKDCRRLGYSGLLIQNKAHKHQYLYSKATAFSTFAYLIYVELDPLSKTGLKSLTFGLADKKGEIVSIANSDVYNEQIDVSEIIRFTKQNTIERFGPVRSVKPNLIFQLHFDGISTSKRRKSGLLLTNVVVQKKIKESHFKPGTLEELKKNL